MTDIPSLVESVLRHKREYDASYISSHEWVYHGRELRDAAPILATEVTRLRAELETERRKVEAFTEALYDGFKVYSALSETAKKRTSAKNVSDTLDALAALTRSEKGEL